jgi:hypothetical protein
MAQLSGHLRTIQEVTGALPASGLATPIWTGQRTDCRFYTSDDGPDKVGPAGWQARMVKITAQPAQACTVLVEGGYIGADAVPPYVVTDIPGYPVPDPSSYDPWVWLPVGSVSFNAGQLVSKAIVVAPYRWVRVRLANGSTAQGAVTVTEDFSDE